MSPQTRRSAAGKDAGGPERRRRQAAREPPDSVPAPVAPYLAVGLSTVVHGVGSRKDIARNLQIIEDAIHAAVSIIGINMPVKLIALAEGALTGFTDEIFDIPHVTAARELFIDIPGAETDRLAALARQYETYIVVQCKARWPEVMPDRFFNTLFVISPEGEIVHKRGQEPPVVPRALVHAARRLRPVGGAVRRRHRRVLPGAAHRRTSATSGTICCSDGEYPEAVRALAFNGAEVVYRPSEAVPMTQVGLIRAAGPGCCRTARTPTSTTCT